MLSLLLGASFGVHQECSGASDQRQEEGKAYVMTVKEKFSLQTLACRFLTMRPQVNPAPDKPWFTNVTLWIGYHSVYPKELLESFGQWQGGGKSAHSFQRASPWLGAHKQDAVFCVCL